LTPLSLKKNKPENKIKDTLRRGEKLKKKELSRGSQLKETLTQQTQRTNKQNTKKQIKHFENKISFGERNKVRVNHSLTRL